MNSADKAAYVRHFRFIIRGKHASIMELTTGSTVHGGKETKYQI